MPVLPVIELSPSDIRFTQDSIRKTFGDGRDVNNTIRQILRGELSVLSLPRIRVVNVGGCYFAFDNRRLYVYRVLQFRGFLKTVQVNLAPSTQLQPDKWTTTNEGQSVSVRRETTLKHTREAFPELRMR